MTVKEWLSRARNIDAEISELKKERKKAREAAASVTAPMSGEKVQTSTGNTTEKRFINYAAYSELIDRRIDELYAVKTEIQAVINSVEDNTLRMLLTARYISGETWERVAEDINYSFVHTVHRLHPKALRAVEEILAEQKEGG